MRLEKYGELNQIFDYNVENSVRQGLIPIVTKNGIMIGSYMIKPKDGLYHVTKKKETLYKTYSKSAAMIIALMLNKNMHSDIQRIISADFEVFSNRNKLEIFKYHYNRAIEKDDELKKDLMFARFEIVNCRYQQAKHILKKSYSRLF